MGKYILFIRNISIFAFFFLHQNYIWLSFILSKKKSKNKIGSPSEMGIKTKVSQCE